jgi:ribonucleotide reductase alpha subunit
MSADRGAFIDQSQSLNVHLEEVNYKKLSAMHFFSWEKGLKTGMYYLRTRPAMDPIKFTVDYEKAKKAQMAVSSGQYEVSYKATAPSSAVQPEIFDMSTQQTEAFKQRPSDSQFECEGCGS